MHIACNTSDLSKQPASGDLRLILLSSVQWFYRCLSPAAVAKNAITPQKRSAESDRLFFLRVDFLKPPNMTACFWTASRTIFGSAAQPSDGLPMLRRSPLLLTNTVQLQYTPVRVRHPLANFSDKNTPAETEVYYIRVGTFNDEALLAQSADETTYAQIVADELRAIAQRKQVQLARWAIVNNALYALVNIQKDVQKPDSTSQKTIRLNAFVASIKAATAKRINLVRNQPGRPVWQRSYQEQKVMDDLTLIQVQASIDSLTDVLLRGQAEG